jgi:hypothetical protein
VWYLDRLARRPGRTWARSEQATKKGRESWSRPSPALWGVISWFLCCQNSSWAGTSASNFSWCCLSALPIRELDIGGSYLEKLAEAVRKDLSPK